MLHRSSIESAGPLEHPAKLTQYLGVISLEIDRNGEYFSRLLVLAVMLLRSESIEHDPGIPWIPHISRQEISAFLTSCWNSGLAALTRSRPLGRKATCERLT